MGEAALARCPEIDQIRLMLPNRHHLLVDLAPFGLENPNEVFMATREPFGRIEAVVAR
jgi:urate oxidase